MVLEKLKKISSLLDIINDSSRKILQTALPVLQDLRTTDNRHISGFLEECPDIDAESAQELLQNIALDYVEDAQSVLQEVPLFSEALLKGEEELERRYEDYPFLYQVWSGDSYGKSHEEGLEMLSEDLKKQYANLKKRSLVEIAVKQISSAIRGE